MEEQLFWRSRVMNVSFIAINSKEKCSRSAQTVGAEIFKRKKITRGVSFYLSELRIADRRGFKTFWAGLKEEFHQISSLAVRKIPCICHYTCVNQDSQGMQQQSVNTAVGLMQNMT
jgi:hypothetical protein